MPEFKKLIAKLKKHYGVPAVPPATGPFELVMWENACYLLPDDRRAAVFEGLRKQVGINAKAILTIDADVLLALIHAQEQRANEGLKRALIYGARDDVM